MPQAHLGRCSAHALCQVRILIVEDDPFVAWKLSGDLSARGATVYSPKRDAKSVERLAATFGLFDKVDVAILDLNLETHTSAEIAEALGKAGVPFLVYTGEPSLPPGFPSDYGGPIIRKPSHADTIAEKVLEVLGQRAILREPDAS